MRTVTQGRYQLTPEGKLALLFLACSAPVLIAFNVFGQAKIGISVCVCFGILLFVMRGFWQFHKYAWYWLVTVLGVLVEVPFIFYVPWNNRAFRGALLLLGMVDYLIVWGGFKVAEKLTRGLGPRKQN